MVSRENARAEFNRALAESDRILDLLIFQSEQETFPDGLPGSADPEYGTYRVAPTLATRSR